MAQLMGPQHEENAAEVQSMTARAAELQVSMHDNVRSAREFLYGSSNTPSEETEKEKKKKRPVVAGQAWGAVGPDSDSDSDDGRRDTTYLTEDGQHVIQKQYKLVSGHYALIPYRWELHEVDPILLMKLREKRDKALAKRAAKERKKDKRRRVRDGENRSTQESTKTTEDAASEMEEQRSPLDLDPTPTLTHSAATADMIEKWRTSRPLPRPATTYSQPRRLLSEEQLEEQRKEEEDLARIRETIHLYPHEKVTPPPSPPRIDEHELHRRVSLSQRASAGVPEAWKAALRKGRNQTPSVSSPASSLGTVYWPSYSSLEYGQLKPILPDMVEHEQGTEPVQEESSAAPARRALRRTKRGTWVERFAEDITYDSADDADSDVTVHKVPVRQTSKRNRATSYVRSQSHRIEEDPEDIDIWQQISDANDEGKRPMRRY
jgi:hypothetical protein